MRDYVTIGQLNKPRGTRGEVEVLILTDFPERFRPGLRVFLVPPMPDRRELLIKEVEHQPKGLVLAFEGLETRNQVEALRGHYIAVPSDEVVELPEDYYWIDDLVGLEMVTTSGEVVGTVKDITRGAGGDMYVVVDGSGRERLIPAVEEIVKEIDPPNGKIVIDPMPGLLDL